MKHRLPMGRLRKLRDDRVGEDLVYRRYPDRSGGNYIAKTLIQ